MLFGILFLSAVLAFIVWLIVSDQNKEPHLSDETKDLNNLLSQITPTTAQIPISGAFHCPICGANTVIKNEVSPSSKCQFCNSPIPEIQNLIEARQNSILEERKQRTETAQQAIRLKRTQIESNHDLEYQKLKNEQLRLEKKKSTSFGVIVLFTVILTILAIVIYKIIMQISG